MRLLVNGKEEEISVFWGEKVTVTWELEENLAVLYPYNWNISTKKGSMTIPVYENMDFILRSKTGENGKSEQKAVSINVKRGNAGAELSVMINNPENQSEPIASLDIEYQNASYGYLNNGTGRVDGTSVDIYKNEAARQEYRFFIPYDVPSGPSYSVQKFKLYKK